MPGKVARNLERVIADLAIGQSRTAIDQAGQVLNDVVATIGGLTQAGIGLGSALAGSVTWIAVGTGTQAQSPTLTALATETARVPVVGLAALNYVVGVLDAATGDGWLTEMGVFGGPLATSTLGSGVLYAYCPLLPGPWLKTKQLCAVVQWSPVQ